MKRVKTYTDAGVVREVKVFNVAGVEFLRPAALEVEDLIVYAQRFGELRGGHTDGLKHVFDDAASHRNELVLSYVILHICNKIIFAMASNHSHNQHL